MKQLSLFDLIAPPEPPKETGEFIVWFANVSGKGEHVLARLFDGSRDFAPRQMILDNAADIITFPLAKAIQERDRLKARLGAVKWIGSEYEIEDLWSKEALDWYLAHKEAESG